MRTFNDDYHAGTPPWDIGRPQPRFVTLGQSGAVQGSVLDVGCGTGENALAGREVHEEQPEFARKVRNHRPEALHQPWPVQADMNQLLSFYRQERRFEQGRS